MYGFSKVMHLQQGVLKAEATDDSEMLEFRNENFQKDQPDLLYYIHRKKSEKATGQEERALLTAGPSATGDGQSGALSLDLRTILNDIAAIRKHQTTISTELKDIATSNKELWNEAVASRERHQRHQDAINKIVRFLGEVFGGKVVEASDLGQATQNTTPSAGSSPDSTGDPGPSHPSAHPPRRPNRRTLLIKGPEEQPGSGGQITEIEVPDDNDIETIPTISGETTSTDAADASTLAPNGFGESSSGPAMLPSPIASPTHHHSLSSVPGGFSGLSIPESSKGQMLLPFLQQGSSSGFTPPPSWPGPDAAQGQQLEKSQRDYRALESEMVHLQSKIDRLIAQLPPDQQSHLKDSSSLDASGSENADADFGAWLSQLGAQSSDPQPFAQPAQGDGSLEWLLNNGISQDGSNQDFYNLDGFQSQQGHYNPVLNDNFLGADQSRFEDYTNSGSLSNGGVAPGQAETSPQLSIEELNDSSPPAAADEAEVDHSGKGKKRAASTRSSSRKKTKT